MSKPLLLLTSADRPARVLGASTRQQTMFPRDWAGRLQPTPEQVATADRLIAEGLAAPIDPGEYDPRARTHLQLTRMVGWRSDGKFYVSPEGEVVGHGHTLAEARRNRNGG